MKNLFWYEYRLRGCSPGCQPGGFVEVDHNHGRWGKVAYDHPLKPEQLEEHELLDLNERES